MTQAPSDARVRWLLLTLILLSFWRLAFRLDQKNLWFDESLSLQRAESPLVDLLRGRLTISDGVEAVDTTDQHPFGYFALLGLFVRLGGKSEFVLRFPAAIAGTLLVPASWAIARRLTRRGALPGGTAGWAALFVAFAPFYLWYGQEARMYTLVPLLALVSTYVLLRWCDARGRTRRLLLLAYVASLAALLSTHFFSVLLLPVQAAIVYSSLASRGLRRAVLGAAALIGLGAGLGLISALQILGQPGAGTNFSPVSVGTLARDLLNAFSLGPSANVGRMLWLDLIFGGLAVVGSVWGLSTRERAAAGGWLLPVWVLAPVAMLAVINRIHPAYMTARHMSLISAAFLILVGAGLAWLAARRLWVAGAVSLVLLAGMMYSSYSYYAAPQFGKGDMAGMGAYLNEEVQRGDMLIMGAPGLLRLYRYYLPLDFQQEGVGWRVLPGVKDRDTDIADELEPLLQLHRRIWLVNASDEVRTWMQEKAFRIREVGFESPISVLRVELFVPDKPIIDGVPGTSVAPTDISFGEHLRLDGYEIGQALPSNQRIPITLYWQATAPISRRYKYVLQKVLRDTDGSIYALPRTEREPYDGMLPTTDWPAGKTVVELTDVLGAPVSEGAGGQPYLALQIYDAETLEKLPVVVGGTVGEVAEDGRMVLLPYQEDE